MQAHIGGDGGVRGRSSDFGISSVEDASHGSFGRDITQEIWQTPRPTQGRVATIVKIFTVKNQIDGSHVFR